MGNLLHAWWQMMPKEKRPLPHADAAIRQARQDIGFLAVLPAQARTTTAIARTYGTVVVEALTITNTVKSARGTIEEPGKNVAQKCGLNRSISGEAWGRTVTMLTYKTAQLGGTLVKVPAPGTSRRCSACGRTTPGSRESQAVFVRKNPDCGWSGNADHNAARNVLPLYRMGLALVPAAGRTVVRRAQRVKPAAAR